MRELLQCDQNLLMEQLEKKTFAWFRRNNYLPTEELFLRYFYESRRGCFSMLYSQLLDDSLDCLATTLPVLSNRLSPEVSRVINAPPLKVRQMMNMIIYWLIQSHARKNRELPNASDARDIIMSIFENNTLRLL